MGFGPPLYAGLTPGTFGRSRMPPLCSSIASQILWNIWTLQQSHTCRVITGNSANGLTHGILAGRLVANESHRATGE
ncbi:hypothetical protein BJY00DRAFT_294051 [Aspergillus carlsbadensis]|nr:hypothetical protein BJY00DRAFT_294051 [Aspergillus carlsbadensis]